MNLPLPNTRYRFGFVLNTTIGNMTRYVNLRKYAERDQEIDFTWAPVNHYTAPDFPSSLRFLPDPLFMRARVLQQATPVLRRLGSFDAVMFHLYEADLISAARRYLFRRPLRISSTDEAPITNRGTYPLYPADLAKPVWRQNMRLKIDRWRVGQTDVFIPFSSWVADILTADCGAPREHVHPLHVGLDLDVWQPPPRTGRSVGEKLRILFVGSDFVRKGGNLLLDVFQHRLQGRAELHLVTKQAPARLPPDVFVHADLGPNDERLVDLYGNSDLLVVPTTADLGPLWSFMEAMAMRLPIVGTDTGSNTELVQHGVTGLVVKVGDGDGIAEAIHALAANTSLRLAMGDRGRSLVEAKYNAARNVPQIIGIMKDAVDRARASRRP
jgi:glycosyltransferase involved in cell wall biosynthesis